MLITAKEEVKRTVEKLSSFYNGEITPITTGKPFIDNALLGGLRPSNVLSIVALSYHGKTYLMEEIMNHIIKNYKDVVHIDCRWEIEALAQMVNRLAKETKKSAKEILTKAPTEEEIKTYKHVIKSYSKEYHYIQPEPTTADVFVSDIQSIIAKYLDKKIIVTLDNLENVLLTTSSQKKDMDLVVQAINLLKKQHPYICFIVLNQMNRELEQRPTDKKTQFPMKSDIYGSDALYKLSDVVVAKHIPYRLGITSYGVFSKDRYKYIDNYFIDGANTAYNSFKSIGVAFYHILKMRGVEEIYDREDIFCEKMYDRTDGGEKKTVKKDVKDLKY